MKSKALITLLVTLFLPFASRAELAQLPNHWTINHLFQAENPQNDRLLVITGEKHRQIRVDIWKPAFPDNPRVGIYVSAEHFFGHLIKNSDRVTTTLYRVRFYSHFGSGSISGVISYHPFKGFSNRLTAKVFIPSTTLLDVPRPTSLKFTTKS
jgi:hypothetical protein